MKEQLDGGHAGFASARARERAGWMLRARCGLCWAALLWCSGVDSVAAQAAPTDADATPEAASDDIIVTAEHRETAVQDTPIAVTAMGGEALAERNVADVQGLQKLTPSLTWGNQWGGVGLEIRGIGSDILNIGADPGVALHIDGVYLSSNQFSAMGLHDLKRVEVLRGPQGTLYGRNATGGIINLITNDPGPTWEANGRIAIGKYNERIGEAAAGGPIVEDVLGVRMSFASSHHDGYTPNPVNPGKEFDDEARTSARLKLVLTPSNELTAKIGFHFSQDRGNGPANVHGGQANPAAVTPAENAGYPTPVTRGERVAGYDSDVFLHRDVWGVNGQFDWALGIVASTLTVGYWERTLDNPVDSDASAAPESYLPQAAYLRRDEEQKSFVADLHFGSDLGTRFRWQAGAFLFVDDSYERLNGNVIPVDATLRPRDTFFNEGTITTQSYALYGEASYDIIAETLTLTLGYRFSHDAKDSDNLLTYEIGSAVFLGPDNEEHIDESWSAHTPRLIVGYKPIPDTLVYASVSRGFKPGGINFGGFQGRGYEPEFIWNYELGAKAALWRRAVASLAVFRADYRDLQQTQVLFAAQTIENAASATIQGAEVELSVRPADMLTVDLGVTYLDAEFDEFITGDASFPELDPIDRAGNRLPRAPKWRANAGAGVNLPVWNAGDLKLRVDYYYRDRVYFTPLARRDQSQSAYGLLDASLTFYGPNDRWSVALYARNLTDESYREGLLVSSGALGNIHFDYYGPPRTYGIATSFKL